MYNCILKELREKKKITQEELGNFLGISRQSINSIERGKSTPSLILAYMIALFFEMSIEEIFFNIREVK